MNIFYMSTAMPDKIYEYIVDNCNAFKPTYSGVGFDRNIAEGLSNLSMLEVISLAPIPSYPKYKYLVWKRKMEKQNNIDYYMPAMLNIPIFKEIWFMISAFKLIIKWFRKINTNDKVIIISGLYRCYMVPASIAKYIFGVKIYAVVPDIPEIMSTYRNDYSKIRRLLNKVEIKIGKRFRKRIDGFILLTEHMNSQVNNCNVPYLVVDGMIKMSQLSMEDQIRNSVTKEKTIMYAGKLSKQFGVDKLISAFLLANIENTTLLLYGDGDYISNIKNIVTENQNIVYGGVVSHDEILKEERRVDLLVEPRPSDLILSKMAFPSKIIEYMASGTPVLTTNLPCFSEDYAQYQFRFNSEDIAGMANTLSEVLLIDNKELQKIGQRAKEFVLNEKNIDKQCERIFKFIEMN